MQTDAFKRFALRPKAESQPRSLPSGRTLEPHHNWTRDDNEEALARIIAETDVLRHGQHDQLGGGAYLFVWVSDALLNFLATFGADTEDAEDSDPPEEAEAGEDDDPAEEDADRERERIDDEPNADNEPEDFHGTISMAEYYKRHPTAKRR